MVTRPGRGPTRTGSRTGLIAIGPAFFCEGHVVRSKSKRLVQFTIGLSDHGPDRLLLQKEVIASKKKLYSIYILVPDMFAR